MVVSEKIGTDSKFQGTRVKIFWIGDCFGELEKQNLNFLLFSCPVRNEIDFSLAFVEMTVIWLLSWGFLFSDRHLRSPSPHPSVHNSIILIFQFQFKDFAIPESTLHGWIVKIFNAGIKLHGLDWVS